jgi:uncharacterized RDD family membrane protein YckC
MNKAASNRAGFRWRCFALIVDVLLIKAVFTAIALLLFGATQGYIRVDDPFLGRENCIDKTSDEIKALGVALPAGFNVTQARDCEQKLFGVLVDRKLEISDSSTKSFGSISTKWTQSFDVALDRDGRKAAGHFYIDNFALLLFALYVISCETLVSRTLGKRLAEIRVMSQGEVQPPSLHQVVKRFFWRFLPFIVLDAFGWIVQAADWDIMVWPGLVLWAVCLAAFLAIAINFLLTVPRRKLPWHDRIAGTEVVWDPA